MHLRMNLSRLLSGCALLAVLTMTCSAHAQKKADTADSAQAGRDPASLALRDTMVKAYRDLRGIHERITQKQWKTAPDQALTLEIEFRFRKPNLLYLSIDYPYVVKPGRWQLTYACNGKTLTIYNSARNEFQTIKAPARLDKLALPLALRGPEFAALLRDASPFDDLEKSAIVRYSEAFESVEGQPIRVLKLELQQDGAKRVLRYRLDPKDNLIRGLFLGITPDPNAVDPFADPETASALEAHYTLLETNPHFTSEDFRFTPPAGAVEKKSE